jgi:hypothetical protein
VRQTAAGYVSGSTALLADGVASLSDLFSGWGIASGGRPESRSIIFFHYHSHRYLMLQREMFAMFYRSRVGFGINATISSAV